MLSAQRKKKYNRIFLILIILYLFPSFYFGIKDYFYYKKELERNKKRYEKLIKEVEDLKEIVNNLNDPYIIEKLAREKLFMVRPGEIPILIIEKNSKN
ncbi:MAG: septum formation initiator family protein [Dictyoglomus sp.]|nr:septum formation initiator family protein [Dictyoglomus sp.]MCX7942760.1 septum formation initiator family protein [Dictyoglomaceae bacterium]MDW8187984.1 septum formation initiator family protein [Dictyoglomus sp.]